MNTVQYLRSLVGDGTTEWVSGPIRASVLSEAADLIETLGEQASRLEAICDSLLDVDKLAEVAAARMGCDECARYKQEAFDAHEENLACRSLIEDMYEYVRFVGYAGRTIAEQRKIVNGFADRMEELGMEVKNGKA